MMKRSRPPAVVKKSWRDDIGTESDGEAGNEFEGLEIPPSSDEEKDPSHSVNSSAGSRSSSPKRQKIDGETVGGSSSSTAEVKEEEKLVKAYIRFTVRFGPSTSHAFVVETLVTSYFPKKLRVVEIGDLIELEEDKDEETRAKERNLELTERGKHEHIAGVGQMERVFERNQSFKTHTKEDFPAIDKVLGQSPTQEVQNTCYLLTDCESRIMISLGNHTARHLWNNSDLRILGRILAPVVDANLTEDEDPKTALQFLLIMEKPQFCVEPFDVIVTQDLGRMIAIQEKSHLDLITQVLLDFEEGHTPKRIPKFQEASEFEGERPGYVFKSGPKGIGYYEDLCLKLIWKPEQYQEEMADWVAQEVGAGPDGTVPGSPNAGTAQNEKTKPTGRFLTSETEAPEDTRKPDRFFAFDFFANSLFESMECMEMYLSAREQERDIATKFLKSNSLTGEMMNRFKELEKNLGDFRSEMETMCEGLKGASAIEKDIAWDDGVDEEEKAREEKLGTMSWNIERAKSLQKIYRKLLA